MALLTLDISSSFLVSIWFNIDFTISTVILLTIRYTSHSTVFILQSSRINNFILISVGVNCHFDPFVSLDALKVMKKGLEEANLLDTTYLMCQPLGYFTPDAGKQGFIDLPEFPFGLEPRICTRWDMHRYAREAWELGVR